jgi:hypothetical protein
MIRAIVEAKRTKTTAAVLASAALQQVARRKISSLKSKFKQKFEELCNLSHLSHTKVSFF